MNEDRDTILIVEDDDTFSRMLQNLLKKRFAVVLAKDYESAAARLSDGVCHAVVLDVRLGGDISPDTDGLRLLEEIRNHRPLLPVLVLTSIGSVDLAVRAMKLGADDFLEKGSVSGSELVSLVKEIISNRRDNLRVREDAAKHNERDPFHFVASAPEMDLAKKSIKMAASDGHCSVLITGETGTGKEVVAQAIHAQGWRSKGPFVAVPTPSLSESLFESELFGHEKGAFTGAQEQRIGYVERANGGVLFLDEIGDLTGDLQVKLLRFLETRVIQRVGSTVSLPVDIQVVSANE